MGTPIDTPAENPSLIQKLLTKEPEQMQQTEVEAAVNDARSQKGELDTLFSKLSDEKHKLLRDIVGDGIKKKLENLRGGIEQPSVAPASKAQEVTSGIMANLSFVSGKAGELFEWVQTNVIKPVTDSFKNNSGKVGQFIMRRYYEFIASPKKVFGQDVDLSSLLGTDARKNLAFMDVQDAVAEHQRDGVPGETITMDTNFAPDQWIAAKDLIPEAKNREDPVTWKELGALLKKRTINFIANQRRAGIKEIKVTMNVLVQPEEAVKAQAEATRQEKLKEGIMKTVPKITDAKQIQFGAETSFDGSVLKVSEADFNDQGQAKDGTKAAALVEAIPVLEKATKITIATEKESDESSDKITLDLSAKSIVLPAKNRSVGLGILNTLFSEGLGAFTIIEIVQNDRITGDQVRTYMNGDRRVLHALKNDTVLTTIASHGLTNYADQMVGEGDKIFVLQGGSFSPFVTSSVPAQA